MHLPRTPLTSITVAAGLLSGGFSLAAPVAGADQPVKARVVNDTLVVKGTAAADRIALRLAAGDPQTLQVDFGDNGSPEFQVARSSFDRIRVLAGAGDDNVRIDDSHGAFTTSAPTQIDGQSGDDTLTGGAGAESFLGGPGADSVDGNGGADVASLGAGNDTFTWDPGDGSDVVNGDEGRDLMVFNGANGNEKFDVSANGDRVRFFRDAGNITMDVGGLEEIDTNALGGADQLTVNDLSGTGLTAIGANLASAANGDDGAADQVIVNGTAGNDAITASGQGGTVRVTGLAALVGIKGAVAAQDSLVINGLAGNDLIDGSGLTADAIKFQANGGEGDDTLLGGAGVDVLDGGPGNNTVVQN